MNSRAMACKDSADQTKPALALSGGGFRATLFHLGSIIRLNQLGMLPGFERISSVSGGSITSGRLAVAWHRLRFSNDVATNLDEEVVQPLKAFCARLVDAKAITEGAITPGKTIGNVLADIYDEALFHGASLQDLPDKPQFTFNATNLQTGKLVRIRKIALIEQTIGEISHPDLRVAVAVAASSAFPPVLSPVEIHFDPTKWLRCEGTYNFKEVAYKRKLSLTDGGAYDNLGLETVDKFKTLVVSDAGAPFSTEESANPLWFAQALRVLDIATDQARSVRKRFLFASRNSLKQRIAFAGIDTAPYELDEYPARRILQVHGSVPHELSSMRTRLNRFNDEDQGRLINWGWYMTDLAVRSYILTKAKPPAAWPEPEHDLSRPKSKRKMTVQRFDDNSRR